MQVGVTIMYPIFVTLIYMASINIPSINMLDINISHREEKF